MYTMLCCVKLLSCFIAASPCRYIAKQNPREIMKVLKSALMYSVLFMVFNQAASLKTIVFDKTGTLTQGR
jgi:cation transport ATPase